MRYFRYLLTLAGVFILIYFTHTLVLNPSLSEDEGYYLGATQAVLNGDFFMTHYSLDKPFLIAFWPILGVFVAGPHPLGYRLVAWLCFLFSFVVFQKILSLFSKNRAFNFVFSLFVYSLPLVQRYGVSLFCEPYLLFMLNLLLWSALTFKSSKKVTFYFLVSFFTKYSMALWLPLLLGLEWIQNKKLLSFPGFKDRMKLFFQESKFFIFIWFIFSIANASKFGSVLWLRSLTSNASHPSNGWTNFKSWLLLLISAHSNSFMGVGFLLVFCFGGVFYFFKKDFDLRFKIIWGATLIHFFAFIFTGAFLLDRYLVSFLPVYFLSIFIILYQWSWAARKLKFHFQVALMLLFVGFIFLQLKEPLVSIAGSPALGRKMYALREEINRKEALLQTDSVWQTAAFHSQMKMSGCIREDCYQSLRKGNSIDSFHYLFLANEPEAAPEIWRAPLVFSRSVQQKVQSYVFPMPENQWVELILKAMKLHKSLQVESVLLESAVDHFPLSYQDRQDFKPLFNGPRVKIKARLKKFAAVFGKDAEVDIEGRLGINELKELNTLMNRPRPTLVFEVERLSAHQKDFTDYLPLFFNGYTFVLDAFPLDWNEHRSFEALDYDEKKEAWKLTVKDLKLL